MVEIVGEVRSEDEKPKALRRKGFVPAVVYGQGKVYYICKVSLKDMKKNFEEIRKEGGKFILNINGEKVLVLIKDVQIDPISEEPIHFDFMKIK